MTRRYHSQSSSLELLSVIIFWISIIYDEKWKEKQRTSFSFHFMLAGDELSVVGFLFHAIKKSLLALKVAMNCEFAEIFGANNWDLR